MIMNLIQPDPKNNIKKKMPRKKDVRRAIIFLVSLVAFVGVGLGIHFWTVADRQNTELAVNIALLNSNYVKSRIDAISALVKVHNDKATDALIQALKNTSYPDRLELVEALGQLGSPNAISILVSTLSDQDLSVRFRSAFALAESRNEAAIDTLIAASRDQDSEIRTSAYLALGRIGNDRTTELLLAALNENYNSDREGIVNALGLIDNPKVTETLGKIFQDKNDFARFTAASALGKIANERSITILTSALQDVDVNVRYYAAFALAQSKNEIAFDSLVSALEDEIIDSPHIRQNAINALGEMGSERAAKELMEQVYKYLGVDFSSVISGIQMGLPMEGLLLEARDIQDALVKIGSPAIEPMITALDIGNADISYVCAYALSQSNDIRAINRLNDALTYKDMPVVAGAYVFFIMGGKTEAEPLLVSALNHYGNVVMAEIYLNSGNDSLSQAAYNWADVNGYQVIRGGTSSVRWGNK